MNYRSNKPGRGQRPTRTQGAQRGVGGRSRGSEPRKVRKTSIRDIFRSGGYRGGLKSFGWPFVIGLLLIVVGIFLFGAFVSYIATGAEDQSLLLEQGTMSAEEMSRQMGGKFGIHGSKLMHTLINGWLGLGMLFLFYLVPLKGISLLLQRRIPFVQQTIFCIMGALWLSAALALMPDGWTASWFFLPGGSFGEMMVEWLTVYIGVIGVVLVLLLVLAVLLYFSIASFRQKYSAFALRQRAKNAERGLFSAMEEDRSAPASESVADECGSAEDEETLIPFAPDDPVQERAEGSSYGYDIVTEGDTTIGETTAYLVPQDRDMEAELSQEEDDDVSLSVVDARHDEEYTLTPEERAARIVAEQGLYDPHKELPRYQMPDIDLLRKYTQENDKIDEEEIRANKQLISETLKSFKIGVLSITATVGPAITLYEVVPAQGVHISRIKGLEDNISMSLSALGIRIIAPMPGKGTIGMEVPNKNPQIVSMRSVIASKAFQESKAALPVALGKTITNEVFVFDLAKVPHLLVAGATGQGKSVGLNAIITSLLYKRHPSELKFVMVDPKMVEFSMYSLIEKHYMAKLPDETQTIITDTARVAKTLNSLCQEMDDRYELLASAHVRNIREYNEKFTNRRLNSENGHRFLPYIVLIIDEYGDLLITAGKEIETPITRLAQKARAVGIHAIIATQRPTASIITGAIKSNFPGRIAFRVTSQLDSRIILDASGANRLVGKGDLLYSSGNDLTRVQCAFIDTPEVNEMVEFIGDQHGYPHAYDLPEVVAESSDSAVATSGAALDPNNRDALFEEVAERLVAEQKASISFIQQIYAIGYNRAARLMVQLEAAGIVSGADGQKPREVLIKSYDQLHHLLRSNDE